MSGAVGSTGGGSHDVMGAIFTHESKRWLVVAVAPSATDGRLVAYAIDMAVRTQTEGLLNDSACEFDMQWVRLHREHAPLTADDEGSPPAMASGATSAEERIFVTQRVSADRAHLYRRYECRQGSVSQ